MARENGDFSRCADPVPLRFRAKVKEGRILFPPKASICLLLRRHGLDNFDLTAIVGTALRAHSEAGAEHRTWGMQRDRGQPASRWSCVSYHVLLWILFP